MNIKNDNLFELLVRSISACGLALFATVFMTSSIGINMDRTFAASGTGNNTIEVDIPEFMSISVDNSMVNMSIMPTAASAFTTGDSRVNVVSNSENGYMLRVDSNTDHTAMKNVDDSVETAISTIESDREAKSFDANTWGWSSNGILFQPLADKDNSTVARNSSNAAWDGEETTITYGASVNFGIESGSYQNTVRYTLIAQ